LNVVLATPSCGNYKEEPKVTDPNQQNVDDSQVSTQDVTPAGQQVPAANEPAQGDAGTPLYDGLQEPKSPDEDEDAQVASHNVFEQNKQPADPNSTTDNVYPVDADDPASIEAALRKHHEAHGA
jgi:hypothetical protein